MKRLFSTNNILRNITKLSFPFLKKSEDYNDRLLRDAYLKYLSQLGFFSYPSTELPLFMNYTPVGIEDYPAGMEDFLVTSSEENSQEDTNDTIWPYKNPKVRLHAIHQAYDSLKKHDNEFTRLFDILIYAVFSDTNGFYGRNSTNPKYPGFIGIHKDLLGNKIGLQEVLIHEFTHTTVFIDEHAHGYFTDYDIAKKDTIISGMMGVPIPLTRALHSVIVACEILLARDELFSHQQDSLAHPMSDVIIPKSKHTIDLLRTHHNKTGIFKKRPLEILDRCAHTLDQY